MNTTQFIMITIKLQFNRIIQCTCLPHPTPLSNAIMSLVSGDLRDPSGLKLEDFGDFGKIWSITLSSGSALFDMRIDTFLCEGQDPSERY